MNKNKSIRFDFYLTERDWIENISYYNNNYYRLPKKVKGCDVVLIIYNAVDRCHETLFGLIVSNMEGAGGFLSLKELEIPPKNIGDINHDYHYVFDEGDLS